MPPTGAPGDIVVAATLDLHGFRKEAAIGRLTQFLEESVRRHGKKAPTTTTRRRRSQGDTTTACSPGGANCSSSQAVWVSVITGTGSHSQHGPVLRDAVKALLEKRGMTYQLTKGFFTIQANSGIVLMPPPLPTDTKVIVVEHTGDVKPNCSAVAVAASGLQPLLSSRRPSCTTTLSLSGPTPRQVHDDDRLVEHVQQTSREEFRSLTKQQQQENAHLNRALSRSEHDEVERKRRLQREEEQALEQALKQSQLASAATLSIKSNEDDNDEEEQRLLQRAMSESQQEFCQRMEDERANEELELERILTASRHEAYAVLSEEEEAQLLQQAICQSLRDVSLVTKHHPQLRYGESTVNEDEDEEQLLRRILEQSCHDI